MLHNHVVPALLFPRPKVGSKLNHGLKIVKRLLRTGPKLFLLKWIFIVSKDSQQNPTFNYHPEEKDFAVRPKFLTTYVKIIGLENYIIPLSN